MNNRKRLLWAGFMAILAAGVGFAVRGGIFATWAAEFGFSGTDLGHIGGAGFTGFCFGIIIGGVVADKIGYGKLVALAFALHLISALVTFFASPEIGKESTYNCLLWGMFIFAYANGTLEAVANPLVATLFPEKRTHYLNILHASWPAGLVLGGLIGAVLGGSYDWSWKAQLALYLVPTALYGLMFFGQHFPKSEASAKGLSIGEMFSEVGILSGLIVAGLLMLFFKDHLQLPNIYAYSIGGLLLIVVALITRFSIGHWLLFVLFMTQALVGAVELGTDGWIQNITGNLLDPTTGKWLFVVASLMMFSLRFCADFIEAKLGLSPVGLLFLSAVIASCGLLAISVANGALFIMLAVLLYALGKTFFWPTMLAVTSDRFPRSGAIAISIMGGIGMMAAGLIGTPGLGYLKDRYSSAALEQSDSALYQESKSDSSKSFLFLKSVTPIDAKKLSDALATNVETRTAAENKFVQASIKGDRDTLMLDACIPAAMAIIYLGLLIYFRKIGGYRRVPIQE